jgi:L-lactate dehydrogenase complex protein LldE
MRVTLFMPCFNDAFFPGTGIATVRILERLGHEVAFPPEQTCCGQIHFNTGYRREAGRLMGRFLKVFGAAEIILAPSASCVAMVREQYPELARASGPAGLEAELQGIASRTYELSELLVARLGVEDLGAYFPHRVTYHPTCHSVRSIDVGDAPLRLLRNVTGLELVPLPRSEECCGFGGTFSVKNPHTSLAMMEDKIRNIRDSGADVVTAVDNSCLMHLAGGMRRMGYLQDRGESGKKGGGRSREDSGTGLRVLHLAEILETGWEVRGP